MPAQILIPTAEAAFIAGLTDRQMNRVVDEHLVPAGLVEHRGNHRLFTRLGAAFAKFYFSTEDSFVAATRRSMLEELAQRVFKAPQSSDVLTLVVLDTVSWRVERKWGSVDVRPYLHDACKRAQEVAQADALINSEPKVMGGTPVFAGTRVPVDIVLSSLATGIEMERLTASYPFLTQAHVQAAEVYEHVHPRRGRPRRLSEVNPELPRRVTRIDKRSATT